VYTLLVARPEGKKDSRYEDNIKMENEIYFEVLIGLI
jgi:hypothetical protein